MAAHGPAAAESRDARKHRDTRPRRSEYPVKARTQARPRAPRLGKPLVYKVFLDRGASTFHPRHVAARDDDAIEPTARLEFVDVATGESVCPAPPERTTSDGAAPTGRIIADLEGVEVEIDSEDLLGSRGEHPRRRRYQFDLDSPADYQAQARARAAALSSETATAKRKPRLFRETFDNAKEAAREFYRGNEDFFDHVHDPFDALRDWMDGIEVRVGKRARRLSQTPAGRRILGEPHAEHAITLAIAYVFGRAKGRRWDAVDWREIERLGEAMEPYFEAPYDSTPSRGGLYWRPIVGTVAPEQLDDLSPEARAQLAKWEGAEEVRQVLAELRETYERNRDCIPPELRSIAERRIAEWDRWAQNPSRIPEYACEPDERTAGYECNYPSVAGELREIERACRTVYDPDWALPEAQRGTPGFPDVSRGPEDPWVGSDEPPFPTEPPPEDEALDGPMLEFGIPFTDLDPPPEEPPPPPGPDASIDLDAPPSTSGVSLAPRMRLLADDGKAFGSSSDAIVRRRETNGVVYQLEYRACGKRNRRTGQPWCACLRDFPASAHGPYWYAYFIDRTGTRRSKYLGKTFRLIG